LHSMGEQKIETMEMEMDLKCIGKLGQWNT
jgi:hypothetical protein